MKIAQMMREALGLYKIFNCRDVRRVPPAANREHNTAFTPARMQAPMLSTPATNITLKIRPYTAPPRRVTIKERVETMRVAAKVP